MKSRVSVFLNRVFIARLPWGRIRRILFPLLGFVLSMYAVIGGLGFLLEKLFQAWGLTNANLHLAPWWAQRVVAYHSECVYGLAYCVSICLGLVLTRKREHVRTQRSCLYTSIKAGTFALLTGGFLTALFLGWDCLRLDYPLEEPILQRGLSGAIMVMILGKLSSEVLTKRIVLDGLLPWKGRGIAYFCSCAISVALSGQFSNPVGMLGCTMFSLVGCLWYERGGLAASTTFQCLWNGWISLIFGFPGVASTWAVYRMYTVSDHWFTGGMNGPESGVATIFVMAIFLAVAGRSFFVKWKSTRLATENNG